MSEKLDNRIRRKAERLAKRDFKFYWNLIYDHIVKLPFNKRLEYCLHIILKRDIKKVASSIASKGN